MDSMKLIFPNNEEIDFVFGKPVVILGANGSGKTRFSVRIEELNDPAFYGSQTEFSRIHRVSAQKSLTIEDNIPIYDYESSQNNLFYGGTNQHGSKNSSRFQNKPATYLLHDFRQVLALLFAEAQIELQEEHEYAKKCYSENKTISPPNDTVVDKAVKIWNTLLSHRTIDLFGNGIHVNFNGQQYHGQEMSDGERVMLYMISQALVVKPNSIFIIDEPELHIHKAILNELWSMLENERPDCVFMYLTHDLDFALSRNNAQYLWIKSYDGKHWDYEFLNVDSYPDLPSKLLLEMLGTRQKIVFVEGTKNSYDYRLYQEIYRDKGYHVIPCGGCQEVIQIVKAKKTYEQLQSIEIYGIIDRDFRDEKEIEELKKDGIYVLTVAEVENLFIVPEILEIMENQLGCDYGTAVKAKQFIIDLFNSVKEKQISEALSREISYQMSLFGIGASSFSNEEINTMINKKYSVENISQWRSEKEAVFNSAQSLIEILRVFNFKDLSKKIGAKYKLADNDFPKRVINVLTKNNEVRKKILTVLSQYVPELP